PAAMLLSGPAGGAVAARIVAGPPALGFDMGGTSCDTFFLAEGGTESELTVQREVAGLPVRLPMVDIHTVSAGGGSIAWVDSGGALRVGPQSAGADPGPACYGRGGTEPTVTDAHLVLDHLDAGTPLAGGVELDAQAAHDAVQRLADRLDLTVEDCATGIVRVADAEMLRALRVMTVEQGIDPRGFALLAFGGAGPLHACGLADALQITRVIVPRAGGVLSALGLAAADRRRDEAQTVLLRDFTQDDLDELAGEADEVAWDVRYVGQSFELTVKDVAAFHDVHEERYGYADRDAPIELVTVRRTWREPGPPVDLRGGDPKPRATGPDVLRLPETTIVVPEGWSATEDDAGTIRISRD
ncbi:MAG TPA: hydantoinase/oxoprolinase family protein, partial [Solirubrobacteraceae bacterium]